MADEIPVRRDQFNYARIGEGHVHAFETGRPHTLCGQETTHEWDEVLYPLLLGVHNLKLCGTCDKAIRARIRLAREAEIQNLLLSAGNRETRRLLEQMVMELSETYGLLVAIKNSADRAMNELHLNRMRLLRILKGDAQSDDPVPGE